MGSTRYDFFKDIIKKFNIIISLCLYSASTEYNAFLHPRSVHPRWRRHADHPCIVGSFKSLYTKIRLFPNEDVCGMSGVRSLIGHLLIKLRVVHAWAQLIGKVDEIILTRLYSFSSRQWRSGSYFNVLVISFLASIMVSWNDYYKGVIVWIWKFCEPLE